MHNTISGKNKCGERLELIHIIVGILATLVTVFVLIYVTFWRYPKLNIDLRIDELKFRQISVEEELLSIKLLIYNNTRERDVTIRPYGEVIITNSRLGLIRCSAPLQSQTENPLDFFIPSGSPTTLLIDVSNSSLSQVAGRPISLSDLLDEVKIKVAIEVEGRKFRNKKWIPFSKKLLTRNS